MRLLGEVISSQFLRLKTFREKTPRSQYFLEVSDLSALLKGLKEAGVEFVLSLETIVALKRESQNPKDRYRLQILEETLRQMREEND